jgi:hypothetical protein
VYCFHPCSRIRDLTHVYAIESLIRPLKGILLISETNAYGRYQWPARTRSEGCIWE